MLTVHDVGERELITRMTRRFPRTSAVRVGIGDDAAVLAPPVASGHGGRAVRWLLASDMLVEGVHFHRRTVPPDWIGWKALACNVSDIAAMGGRPYAAVVSLGLPRQTPVRFAEGLCRGLARCARRYGFSIVGGDTVRAPQVVVDVAILGVARPEEVALRSAARVGDVLYVTGRLGGSLASGRHARFLPRLWESRWLVRHVPIHAMIDLSDGLASDAWQIARASDVTVRLWADRIPVAAGSFTLRQALTDGEDFELFFTVPPRAAGRVPARIRACPVTRIGRITRRGAGVELQEADGTIRPLAPGGFRHF